MYYIEKPAGYDVTPEICVFRWCTEKAISRVFVFVHGMEEGEDLVHIPVCPKHKKLVDKLEENKKAKAN